MAFPFVLAYVLAFGDGGVKRYPARYNERQRARLARRRARAARP